MFFRRNTFFAKVRRFLNTDTWMVKLLGLSVIKAESARPGTVIIQIDGLSHMEFNHALSRGEMPHLKYLLKGERYANFIHYSGQPSCTPAVQAMLFYGVKMGVPAFSFRDKKTGGTFNMFNPSNALEMEKRVKKTGAPLLEDGSAYGDIFTGGAKEAHFCVSSMGWGTLLSAANPLAAAVFILMHLHIILRAAILVFIEFALAVIDSVRGFMGGKNFFSEIKYVPLRVVACVILREVIGIGAKIDIARGMPVIHMNFAGYDEQSHHRGPGSKFAHWSLRAIDNVVRMVWKAAKRSSHRDYDVIIYSDHGQESTEYYGSLYGRPVQEAVNEVLKMEISGEVHETGASSNMEYSRAGLFGGAAGPKAGALDPGISKKCAVITALGPVGHIYTPEKMSGKQKEKVARALVANARIPLVLFRAGRGRAVAINTEGKFMLPRDASAVLEKDHPFMKETARDLAELCGQADSGDIIFTGYRKQGKYITFYNERGSHGGPGSRETAGFAMLPPDIELPGGKTIITSEIREAVFRSLKRGSGGKSTISRLEAPTDGSVELKIMSYNVHACRGSDGSISPERIARVIAAHNPDIVALQEIDERNDIHQAKVIARILSMNFYYHSSVLLKTGLHGNAIFSRFDMKLIKRGSLPSIVRTPFLEKRGAIWAEINAHGRRLQVVNTHLSLFQPEGMMQTRYLMGSEWLGNIKPDDPVIFCGDFNSHINSRIFKVISAKLKSVHFHSAGRLQLRTFPSVFPIGVVDHIFLGGGITSIKTEAPKTDLEKTASDHLPLIAQVRLEQRGKKRNR
jgi:endonuclease/exonuclease/phosphatase family metal-dependent hydrolase